MPAKYKNNASATLAASITTSDTTIVLTTGFGAYFPTLTAGFYFYATLFNAAGESEIVKVTARSADTLTVVRAQDDTTAKAFTAGDGFAQRVVAANLNNYVELDSTQTITGAKTFSAAITATAGLVGNVTGNASGNAGTVTNGVYTIGDQTITGTKTFVNTYDSIVNSTGLDGFGAFYATGSGTNNAFYFFGNASGERSRIWAQNDRGLRFSNNTGTTTHLTLDSGGNLTASGNVTAYSDVRLKSDIQTITNALELVKRLRGAAYIKDGKASIGVIAQEVQEVLPQLVQENSDGYLSVAYGNMVAVLIEAVKELNTKIESLEAK